jgi:hypothetical protein
MQDRLPNAAKSLLSAWSEHQNILQKSGLAYLDALMEVITQRESFTVEDMIAHLKLLVPDMTLTKARWLIELKFGRTEQAEVLKPAM